ncbi:MAG: SEC-C metal-binding domain-containing protein [Planctomycetota bacterium]|nr:SEC-C metal-binding domain-containing protein [Planctomycetota bacterium]
MADPYRRQTIDSWVSDFVETAAFGALAPPAKEYASEILPRFLARACEARDIAPGEIEEHDLKPALLDGVGSLALPASARAVAPDLCAAFLRELETQGRLGGGAALGTFVRALRGAYDEKTADTVKTIRNPGARIGRNDPCPCGSGKKFKKCCKRE